MTNGPYGAYFLKAWEPPKPLLATYEFSAAKRPCCRLVIGMATAVRILR